MINYITQKINQFDAWSENPEVNPHTRAIVGCLVIGGMIVAFVGFIALLFWLIGIYALPTLLILFMCGVGYASLLESIKKSDARKGHRR